MLTLTLFREVFCHAYCVYQMMGIYHMEYTPVCNMYVLVVLFVLFILFEHIVVYTFLDID